MRQPLDSVDLSRLDKLVEQAIEDRVTPGAAYAVGTVDAAHVNVNGRLTFCPQSPGGTPNTLWDLASLTKVVGTTTAAMVLFDRGVLDLDRQVADLIPAFGKNGKDKITIRNLLLHNSGLSASLASPTSYSKPAEVLDFVWNQELCYETGSQAIYSDVGFISLGVVIEILAGMTIAEFLSREVWSRLSMTSTGFTPGLADRTRCAPTEPIEPWRSRLRRLRGLETPEVAQLETGPDGQRWITGEVHDPTAMVLGGVAGHAGLFSTIGDICKFMQLMLNRGAALVDLSTVDLFIRRGGPESSRALGWDTPSEGSSAGHNFGPRSFGHTGFTGTSVWADPDRGIFAVLLTNRVHPTAANLKVKELRVAFHDLVAE